MPLDATGYVTTLSRPKLLARAARAGAERYSRDRDLPGLAPAAVKGQALVDALATVEATCETERRAGAPGYSVQRHVRVLTALLCEARALNLAQNEKKSR